MTLLSARQTRFSLQATAVLVAGWCVCVAPAPAFEGRITAASIQGGQTTDLLYTVGTHALRLEITGSAQPHPVDVVNLRTGALMLLHPHNRSFVRLPAVAGAASAAPAGNPPSPVGITPVVGLQAHPTNAPGAPMTPPPPDLPAMGAMPPMPMMPVMPTPSEEMELKPTGLKTNLLGFACEQFEIRQCGEVMEIWATPALPPFQSYVPHQPPRLVPRLIEERWAGLLTARKLFPLRAQLQLETGPERFCFEVRAITPQKLQPEDAKAFLPPDNYVETQPLPF